MCGSDELLSQTDCYSWCVVKVEVRSCCALPLINTTLVPAVAAFVFGGFFCLKQASDHAARKHECKPLQIHVKVSLYAYCFISTRRDWKINILKESTETINVFVSGCRCVALFSSFCAKDFAKICLMTAATVYSYSVFISLRVKRD